ncbi:hypothetical protein Chor_016749 [Crotalus horridus]
MEESDSTRKLVEQTLSICNESTTISEVKDGIMRELRAMRREMRLMKGEQRRTNARVISLAQELAAFKEC